MPFSAFPCQGLYQAVRAGDSEACSEFMPTNRFINFEGPNCVAAVSSEFAMALQTDPIAGVVCRDPGRMSFEPQMLLPYFGPVLFDIRA